MDVRTTILPTAGQVGDLPIFANLVVARECSHSNRVLRRSAPQRRRMAFTSPVNGGSLARIRGRRHNRPDGEHTAEGTDTVVLASGRMFLPQTDVVLPGVPPLAFTRRAESGYTAGRFVGLLLGLHRRRTPGDRRQRRHPRNRRRSPDHLPHPVPGLPTRPETGTSRNVRSRDEAGDYRAGNSRAGRHGCNPRDRRRTGGGTRRPQGRPPHQDPGPRIAVRPPHTRTKTYFCRRTVP